MKTIHRHVLHSAVLSLLTLLAPKADALTEVKPLTKEDAKDLGISVTSQAYGEKSVWIELSFKVEGALKNYSPKKRHSRVELRYVEGDQPLMIVPIKESRLSAKHRNLRFMVARNQVPNLKLWIVIGSGSLAG